MNQGDQQKPLTIVPTEKLSKCELRQAERMLFNTILKGKAQQSEKWVSRRERREQARLEAKVYARKYLEAIQQSQENVAQMQDSGSASASVISAEEYQKRSEANTDAEASTNLLESPSS